MMLARNAGRMGARSVLRYSQRTSVLQGQTQQVQMRSFASKYYYLPSHEYIRVSDDSDVCELGITDYAQSSLGDIVYVDLPEVGDDLEKGETMGSVESVKAASDVYAPVNATVVEVNEELETNPGLVNSHAMTDGFFAKVTLKDKADLEDLLEEEAYQKLVLEEQENE